ncbi:large conductance mechanosensitive channel protein MscL [Candidatus Kaiserbacteria bacterium CG10_big_fil_rev_8_21_14_0_10_49_17]|uniref:Large conductance mechanosensitive channel protein MscL n=1 Tax=Candidatus Kaiserbacteria bacterium CG10_big_fil_rev_8_21_14_0_10_49_17 TaxID=1974609 RepID=A0A2M6WEF9_9BACT|nr:MAG: large conductance mechanosensitive channel protein MscL [Candidatus Kaiserbacteria bacterium CG10_big_fil_rev_8_21_14_0_10_49_17]
MKEKLQGFITFIREQGVIGLAIGFILGGAVSAVVGSLVKDVINPLIGLAFGSVDSLSTFTLGPIHYGSFIAAIVDFIVIAAVVYFIFRGLGIDTLDKKKG